jgi:hypothetical protein
MQTQRLRRALPAAAAAVLLVLLLAACGSSPDADDGVASLGGSSTTETNAAAAAADQDPEEAALEFAKCMREHGIDVPDPGPNGEMRLTIGPGQEAKMKKAKEACGDLLENARPRLSEEQQSVMQDAMLAFAKCMREHGIDMPDPEFGEGGRVTQRARRGQLDPDSSKFQEAEEACEPIIEEAAREAGIEAPGGPRTSRSSEDDS